MVAHTWNLSTWEMEAGDSGVKGQLHLHSKLKINLSYMKETSSQKKEAKEEEDEEKAAAVASKMS